MKDPFVRAMMNLAEQRSDIMLLTGDLGFGAFESFWGKYPKQFLNVGVAEQNMVGIATGLALEGHTVFLYSIGNFAVMRCLEQIRNDAAYHNVNVNVVAMGGGFSYGALGMSHHLTEDLAVMRAIPGITVTCPSSDAEAEAATYALAQKSGVGYLRLDKTVASSDARSSFQLGKSACDGEGRDICFVACGGIVREVQKARERLQELGVESRLLSVATLKPFDERALLEAVENVSAVVTVEEHSVLGGLGGAVAEVLLEKGVAPPLFLRLGIKDTFTSVVGSQDYLRQISQLDAEGIAGSAMTLLNRKHRHKGTNDERYHKTFV